MEVTKRCTNDLDNLNSEFGWSTVKQDSTVLWQKWIKHRVDHKGNVWVPDDPISFEVYEREFSLEHEAPLTPYGTLTKQMNYDVTRGIIVDSLDLNAEIEAKRGEVVWGHIKDKIELETGLNPDIARNIALYAISGMAQNFEGPTLNRIKKYAREVFYENELIDLKDSLEVSQATTDPRTFTTEVINDRALQVIGTHSVALKVAPSNLSDPYTLGTIVTKRTYIISFNEGKYHASRQPDIYIIGIS